MHIIHIINFNNQVFHNLYNMEMEINNILINIPKEDKIFLIINKYNHYILKEELIGNIIMIINLIKIILII